MGFSGSADRIALFPVGPISIDMWEKTVRQIPIVLILGTDLTWSSGGNSHPVRNVCEQSSPLSYRNHFHAILLQLQRNLNLFTVYYFCILMHSTQFHELLSSKENSFRWIWNLKTHTTVHIANDRPQICIC